MLSFLRSNNISAQKAFLAICLAVTLVRVCIVCWLGDASVLSVEDYNIARNIASGHGFTIGDAYWPTALKAPLYPFFLGAIISLFPEHSRLAAACLQHVMMSMAAFALFMGLKGLIARRASLLAGMLLLLHPSYLVYPSTLEATNLMVPLAIVCIWLFQTSRIRSREYRDSMRWTLGYTVCSALLVLCQPLALPLVIIAGYALLPRPSTRLMMLGVFILLVSPWILRNSLVFHQFIPFKSPVWMNVYAGFDQRSHGIPHLNTVREDDRRMVDSARVVCNDVALEPFYKTAVVDAIHDSPVLFVEKIAIQAVRFWTIPPNYDSQITSPAFIAARLLPMSLLFIGLIWSLIVLSTSDKTLARSIVFVLLYFTAIYALTHTSNIRFKLDVEWLQCISTAMVLHWWMRRFDITDSLSPNITRT